MSSPGQRDPAEQLEALRAAPHDLTPLRLLIAAGAAPELLRRATDIAWASITRDPRLASAELADLLLRCGRPRKALECIDRILDREEPEAALLDLRGRALNNLGDLEVAVDAFRSAVRLDPRSARSWYHLGHAQARCGYPDDAESAFRRSIAIDAQDAAPWAALGRLLTDQNRWDEAEPCFGRAARLAPDRIEAHVNHGLALERLGRLDAAGLAYGEAIIHSPGDPEALARLGMLRLSQGRVEEARSVLGDVLARDPRRGDAAAAMAASFDVAGEYEQGLAWLDAQHGRYDHLADVVIAEALLLQHAGHLEQALARLERVCADRAVTDQQRSLAWFGRGEICDQEDRLDDAWRAYREGNSLQPKRFDEKVYTRHVGRLLQRTGWRHRTQPVGGPRPILVLGLPRSGSSLLEQMISMHPQVGAAGERLTLGLAAPAARNALDAGDEATLGRAAMRYRRDLAEVGGHAPMVTDKMWQNYELLDVVQSLLPDALIVHTSRNPVDVGLSCYFQSFGWGGVPFSYDLDHIAAFIEGYRRIMGHWSLSLDLPMQEVRYEQLVADPGTEMGSLLRGLGLAWEPGCVEPHRNSRVVNTASNAQVREPIHTRRTARWERYREFLPRRLLALLA